MSDNKDRDKPLTILVTRTRGDDEWAAIWGFKEEAPEQGGVENKGEKPDDDDERVAAFITNGAVSFLCLSECEEVNLDARQQEGVWNDDVWVINGRLLYNPSRASKLYKALDTVPWEQRKVNIKIHPGGGFRIRNDATLQTLLSAIAFDNTRWLFRGAGDYSLGGKEDLTYPIVRFATGVRGRHWEGYEENLARLATLPLHVRMSSLKHSLSSLFNAVDINLQGLCETGFRRDYWQDVVEDYEGGKAAGKIDAARELTYDMGGEQDTVEGVIEEANRRYGGGDWASHWAALQSHLPPTGEVQQGSHNIGTILSWLEQKDKLDTVKRTFANERNPVREWVTNLDRAFAGMRDALYARSSAKPTTGDDGRKSRG